MNKHEEATQALINANLLGSQSGKTLNLYIEQCEATEKELEKCNISDTSKEESSMKYYCLYEDTIHKLEQLQQDIKKYFDIMGYEETDEYIELFQRLSKVGEKT